MITLYCILLYYIDSKNALLFRIAKPKFIAKGARINKKSK